MSRRLVEAWRDGTTARWGVAVGLATFTLGAAGESVVRALVGRVPAWEHALFLDLELADVLAMLVIPALVAATAPLVGG